MLPINFQWIFFYSLQMRNEKNIDKFYCFALIPLFDIWFFLWSKVHLFTFCSQCGQCLRPTNTAKHTDIQITLQTFETQRINATLLTQMVSFFSPLNTKHFFFWCGGGCWGVMWMDGLCAPIDWLITWGSLVWPFDWYIVYSLSAFLFTAQPQLSSNFFLYWALIEGREILFFLSLQTDLSHLVLLLL